MAGVKVIVVRLQGGLGNQLFQLSAAVVVANAVDSNEIVLDASRIAFGTDKRRRLGLLEFYLLSKNFSLSVWGEKFSLISRIVPQKLGAFLAVSSSETFLRARFGKYVEIGDSDDITNLYDPRKTYVLNGYFNDFSLVDRAVNIGFNNKLEITPPKSLWLESRLKNIDFENSVALHIRLGDYLQFPQIFGRLSQDYYLKALEYLKYESRKNLYIFSDQPNIAANEIPMISKMPNCEIVRPPMTASPAEAFYLLSQFRNLICANSTYSMWAAWFNNEQSGVGAKKVVVPSPYLLNKQDIATPDSWKKLIR